MPRDFNIPPFYRSDVISKVKESRLTLDPKRRDVSPTVIDLGPVKLKIARHFGFCFGVENAIEIAYRAISENPNKRIFLLSEMIHNPEVNDDLMRRGVKFLHNTAGESLIPFSSLDPQDVVIVPAFGTTVEIQKELQQLGIDPYYYDTTCPFVEKVWKRGAELGRQGFTVIIHGKRTHEETRATFSHSKLSSPTLIILDKDDATFLADFILGNHTEQDFWSRFSNCVTSDFDPKIHLSKIGVINQTTMLATETKEISQILRQALVVKYGDAVKSHFADTRDTLCYATYENQRATLALIEDSSDLAIVVGGYNSSNTSHLVELCETSMPTYYIKNADEIVSASLINHYSLSEKKLISTRNWLLSKRPLEISVTSGASCPDKIVEDVIAKVLSFFPSSKTLEEAISQVGA